MQQLEQDLYIAQPETLFVISPHGESLPDALCINLNGKYVADFSEFGDLATRPTWKSEVMLVDRIREDFSTLPHTHCEGTLNTTFSAGIASYPDVYTAADLTEAADGALLQAKRLGRNRVEKAALQSTSKSA